MPNHVEALQCLCNLRLCQDRLDDAVESLERALLQWLPKKKELYNSLLGNDVDLEDERSAKLFNDLPSPEIQRQAAQHCIEVGKLDTAIEILELCLMDEEEDFQTWHMIAIAHFLSKNYSEASEAIENAEQVHFAIDEVNDKGSCASIHPLTRHFGISFSLLVVMKKC